MTHSKKTSLNNNHHKLLPKDILRPSLADILKYSKRMIQNDVGLSENTVEDVDKIHTLGERLSKAVDKYDEINSVQIHDLRTPLNGIIGYCEMLLEDSDDQNSDLQKVLSAAKQFLFTLEMTVSERTSNIEGNVMGRDSAIHAAMDNLNIHNEHKSFPSSIHRHSILIVDDNEINRELLSSLLKRQGHEVIQATNGQKALEIISNEPVDLILLDIIMPEMNGFEVLQHLRSNPDIDDLPVIVISAMDKIDCH